MAIKAQDVLESIRQEEKQKLKSILVEKNVDLEFDVGNLLAIDLNQLDEDELKSNQEEYLRSLARDNTQLLINEVWKLPIERNEDAVLAKLPDPTTVLPREKPIPKPKTPTVWEEFARVKGIKKKKNRDRMLWDEESQSWRPRFGYKRANDDTKAWVLEVPDNADPYEDQFEKKLKERKERIAKNEYQRLRNIARRTGKKAPDTAKTDVVTDKRKQSSKELDRSFHLAKAATASLGRFEDKLKHEEAPKNLGKRRKFESVSISGTTEREKQLQLVNSLFKKTPKINVEKAANRELQSTFSENVKGSKPDKGHRRSKQGKMYKQKFTKTPRRQK